MTDRELVLQLLSTLREHASRARRRRGGELSAYLADVDAQDALALSVLVATQEAVDVAFHVCSDEGWGVPGSYAEAFALLGQHGVIDAALAAELRRVVAVRNRIAHLYGSVDIERVWHELPEGLDALERFVARMAAFLGPP
ncbi:MAG: DUF86 domain-containing protein [Myxococcales bacterium]|nr:DUF86 domain-containing protein [Myxococcales bacterium]